MRQTVASSGDDDQNSGSNLVPGPRDIPPRTPPRHTSSHRRRGGIEYIPVTPPQNVQVPHTVKSRSEKPYVIPIHEKQKPSHPEQYDLFSQAYPVSPDITSVDSPDESFYNEQMFSGAAVGTFVTPSDATSGDIPVRRRPEDPTMPPKQPSKPPKKKRASGVHVAKIISDDEEGNSTDTELNVPLDYIVIRGKTRSGSWGEGISSTTGFMQRRSQFKSPMDIKLPNRIFDSPEVPVSLDLSEPTEEAQITTTTAAPEVIVPRRSGRKAPKRKAEQIPGTEKEEDSEDPEDSNRDPKRRLSDK